MRKFLASILAAASMLVVCSTAYAIPYRIDFTASGFGSGAPQDPVSGTIFVDKSTTDFSILSLTGIDLTISGHVYTVGEIAVGPSAIGGSVDGLGGINPGSPDFFLDWNVSTGGFVAFWYTTSSPFDGLLQTSTGTTAFSAIRDVSPVPISAVGAGGPGLVLLLGVAVALRRRRMQQAA